MLPLHVGHVVEIAVGVGAVQVQGGRHDAIAHGQQAENRFDRPGCSDRVAQP